MSLTAESLLAIPSPRPDMSPRLREVIAKNLILTPDTVQRAAESRRLVIAQKLDPATGLPEEIDKPVPWNLHTNPSLALRIVEQRKKAVEAGLPRRETVRIAPRLGTVSLIDGIDTHFQFQPVRTGDKEQEQLGWTLPYGADNPDYPGGHDRQKPLPSMRLPFSTFEPSALEWQYQWGARPETGEAFAAPTA